MGTLLRCWSTLVTRTGHTPHRPAKTSGAVQVERAEVEQGMRGFTSTVCCSYLEVSNVAGHGSLPCLCCRSVERSLVHIRSPASRPPGAPRPAFAAAGLPAGGVPAAVHMVVAVYFHPVEHVHITHAPARSHALEQVARVSLQCFGRLDARCILTLRSWCCTTGRLEMQIPWQGWAMTSAAVVLAHCC